MFELPNKYYAWNAQQICFETCNKYAWNPRRVCLKCSLHLKYKHFLFLPKRFYYKRVKVVFRPSGTKKVPNSGHAFPAHLLRSRPRINARIFFAIAFTISSFSRGPMSDGVRSPLFRRWPSPVASPSPIANRVFRLVFAEWCSEARETRVAVQGAGSVVAQWALLANSRRFFPIQRVDFLSTEFRRSAARSEYRRANLHNFRWLFQKWGV